MKKFYIDEKTAVYMHEEHNAFSAGSALKICGLVHSYSQVSTAPSEDQDMLGAGDIGYYDVAFDTSEQFDEDEEALLESFEVLLLDKEECGAERQDHYVLPNGKSAPYGLTGTEIAAMPPKAMLYSVSIYTPSGLEVTAKGEYPRNQLLVAIDRDLVFSTESEAKEAYNAMFGDLYGEV